MEEIGESTRESLAIFQEHSGICWATMLPSGFLLFLGRAAPVAGE